MTSIVIIIVNADSQRHIEIYIWLRGNESPPKIPQIPLRKFFRVQEHYGCVCKHIWMFKHSIMYMDRNHPSILPPPHYHHIMIHSNRNQYEYTAPLTELFFTCKFMVTRNYPNYYILNLLPLMVWSIIHWNITYHRDTSIGIYYDIINSISPWKNVGKIKFMIIIFFQSIIMSLLGETQTKSKSESK